MLHLQRGLSVCSLGKYKAVASLVVRFRLFWLFPAPASRFCSSAARLRASTAASGKKREETLKPIPPLS